MVEKVESMQNSVSAQGLNLPTPQRLTCLAFVMSSEVETFRFSFQNHIRDFLDYARNEGAHAKKPGGKINSPPGLKLGL
jgi:hypothetical protein